MSQTMGKMSDSARFALVEDTIPAQGDLPPQYGVIACFQADADAKWDVITGCAWDTEEERENNRALLEWTIKSAAAFHGVPCDRLNPEEVSNG